MKKKLDRHSKSRLYDLVLVIYFSVMPLLLTYISRPGPLPNTLLVYVISCFFFSLQYEKRLIRFFVLIGLACFITSAIAIGITELFLGYGIFFVFAHITWMVQASIVGYVCALTYSASLRYLLGTKSTWIITTLLFLGIVLTFSSITLKYIAEEDKLRNETNRRHSLAEIIASYHIRSGNTKITTQSVINAGIIIDQTNVVANRLMHGYGGNIKIYTDNNGVWIEYDGLPRGKVCHHFSYINRPDHYGFKFVYVEETLIKSTHFNDPFVVMELSQCFVGERLKTVKFYAMFKDLES